MRRIIGLLAVCLVASACVDRADATGPPEIIYGRDLCVECGMLITEPRFAAAYRIDGEARPFDDIGGMLLYGTKTGELSARSVEVWVHDRDTGDWIAAGGAHYVVADGLVTPMGYGIVAFIDPARAREYASGYDTDVHSWTDLFEFTIEPGRLGHDHFHDTHDDKGSE